ncbi:MAG: BON domain-containing protein [Xanthomonadaceae bacterium]|jgi:osmotically-inducible protein OsmY|nr:BON domain-containing protein [Xanthomonadaceae bacterium]
MLRLLSLVLCVTLLPGCAALLVGGAAAGAGAAHDRRSVGTVIDDNNIELTAYDAINKDKEIALRNNVGIVVYNGVMLLIGEVRTEELRQRAERLASGLQGVRRVVNEISVEEPTGFGGATRDRWLTGRVKLALLDIVDQPGFDPTRVNVTTQNGKVYLMGLVSRAEAERVVEIARGVPGVERVVKVFEYTD